MSLKDTARRVVGNRKDVDIDTTKCDALLKKTLERQLVRNVTRGR